jgi:hypothetical protein
VRTQLDSHFVVTKLGIRWLLWLRSPTGWELLGQDEWPETLIESTMLNSEMDRFIEWKIAGKPTLLRVMEGM